MSYHPCLNFMCLDNVGGLCYGGGCFRSPEPDDNEETTEDEKDNVIQNK